MYSMRLQITKIVPNASDLRWRSWALVYKAVKVTVGLWPIAGANAKPAVANLRSLVQVLRGSAPVVGIEGCFLRLQRDRVSSTTVRFNIGRKRGSRAFSELVVQPHAAATLDPVE